jgi:hypothetical protein
MVHLWVTAPLPQSLEVVGEVAIALLPPLDIRIAEEAFVHLAKLN